MSASDVEVSVLVFRETGCDGGTSSGTREGTGQGIERVSWCGRLGFYDF